MQLDAPVVVEEPTKDCASDTSMLTELLYYELILLSTETKLDSRRSSFQSAVSSIFLKPLKKRGASMIKK